MFPLKQLQRLRPHFGFSGAAASSMNICTILAKQTELGSNCSPSFTSPFAVSELFFRTLGNCLSNNLFNRDFNTGFTAGGVS
ncbi:hypothetical protein HanIR_Chr13g0666341 [Helianthus annuus]|nr:hypothetical protein HanIR_Chr13g0666341 [Helianthus annuus]